ncbi:MAG: hypothetical protein ABIH76_08730 [Candidatus Bathyarchaeota archaeon]
MKKSSERVFSLSDAYDIQKNNELLFISIQPEFSEMIRAGTKTVELRKRKPKNISKFAIIYESSPKQTVSFLISIKKVHAASTKVIWEKYRKKCGVSKKYFNEYYRGSKEGIAILIDKVIPLEQTIPRKILSKYGLTPPQDYRYAQKEVIMRIMNR